MKKQCKYKCNAQRKVFMEGLGRLVDCPDCANVVAIMKEEEEKPQGSVFDKLSIPQDYRGITTKDIELFQGKELRAYSQNSINEVSRLLERINKDIFNGVVTRLSTYIFTSRLVDIKAFVYGAQRMALQKGLGVVPFISCNALFGLQRVGDYTIRTLHEATQEGTDFSKLPPDLIATVEGYRIVKDSGVTYYDFIHADLCIIDATANTTESGWTGLADLLGERAKKGLPTHVIGYWATKGMGTTKGLRYLLANSAASARLDELVAYELVSSKYTTEPAKASQITDVGAVKSSITAGLSVDSLMS